MDAVADFLFQVYDKAGDQLEIPKEHSLQWHLHVASFGVVKGTKSFGPDHQHLPSLRFTTTGDRSITAVPMESLMKVLSQKEHKEKLFSEIEDWALHTVDDEALAALCAAGLVWHLSVTPGSVLYVPPRVCVCENTYSDTDDFRFTCLREGPESVITSVKAWHQQLARRR